MSDKGLKNFNRNSEFLTNPMKLIDFELSSWYH
ncbi:hypothetical protein BECAL_03088 [Bellilinea caldifistulae]|nr:hypothetical protein BECAL_03088 [Bellilinea caldifistulae]